MGKAKLGYTVRTTRAPGESTDTWVPMIVERLQPTELASVVEKCIDRGLIAGLKPTAAQTIAEGVAEQLAKEFGEGRSVQFGQYFYGRPYLSGTVDGNGRLGSGNGINVRLYKGAKFALTLDDFTPVFADGGNNPKVAFLVSLGSEPRGVLVSGTGVKLNGSMLWSAGDTVKVKFAEVGGADSVEVAAFGSLGAELIAFDWPSGLVAGKSYSVTVERTDVNGKTLTTNAKTVEVIAGEPPPPPEPIAESSDGVVKVMSVSDAETGDTFTYGDDWTLVGEGFTGSEPGWFAEVEFLNLGDGSEPIALELGATSATQLTVSGHEELAPAAGTYPDAVIEIGIARYDGEELVNETLSVPISLVVSD